MGTQGSNAYSEVEKAAIASQNLTFGMDYLGILENRHSPKVGDGCLGEGSFVRRLGPFWNSLHHPCEFGLSRHFAVRQLRASVASRPTYKAIKSNFADSINLLLHIKRKNAHRYVS
jgi:hypothetical protein